MWKMWRFHVGEQLGRDKFPARTPTVGLHEMLAPRVEHGLGKHLNPRSAFLPVPIRGIARLDGAGLRLVAEEVRRIHIEALDHSGGAELDHGDVMPFRALAAAFPAVHPLAAVGVFVGDEDGLAPA
jgi:hypothetical protein